MVRLGSLPVAAAALAAALFVPQVDTLIAPGEEHHHRHHHHHHGHHKHHHKQHGNVEALPVPRAAVQTSTVSESNIMSKLRDLEHTLDSAASKVTNTAGTSQGTLEVNAPLPADFAQRFAQAAAESIGAEASEVEVIGAAPVRGQDGRLDEVTFRASQKVVDSLIAQAADPASKLANGPLHSFLVAHDAEEDEEQPAVAAAPSPATNPFEQAMAPALAPMPAHDEEHHDVENIAEVRAQEHPNVENIDQDLQGALPFGDLEPFGREDTAKDLTDSSIRESDEMVDQLERAEVAEEKRSIFRALTRLRGAAITSFDGIARAHSANVDEFSRTHHWRSQHPVKHLAQEENDVSRWAFPDMHDF